MASEFPNSRVRHIYDELGERLEFNESGDVEERERLEVKPLRQSDALVELALNLHIADQHPDTQLASLLKWARREELNVATGTCPRATRAISSM